jgi:Tol biopolymer transport system component
VLTRGSRRHNSPAIAPDESALAFASQGEAQEDIFILERDATQPRQLTQDVAQDRIPRWAPDGQSIIFLSDRSGRYEVWRVRRDGSGLEQLTDAPEAQVLAAIWSPDGRRLLYQARDDNAFIIAPDQPRHARTAQPLPVPPPRGFRPWSWSSDGRLLAGWQILPEHPSQTVIVYSFAEQRYERLAEPLQGKNPIWLNDSRRLLFTDLHKLYLLDLATKQPREVLNVAPNSIGVCSLSADNRRLYYSLFASDADVWLLPLQ